MEWSLSIKHKISRFTLLLDSNHNTHHNHTCLSHYEALYNILLSFENSREELRMNGAPREFSN